MATWAKALEQHKKFEGTPFGEKGYCDAYASYAGG